MSYIVFDLEFNQDFSTSLAEVDKKASLPFEIIQIGAYKLDFNRNTIGSFNRYVRPTLYSSVSPFITELTGITTIQLLHEENFPDVFKAFISFLNGQDTVLCTWGKTDMKELFRNAKYFNLDQNLLPKTFIDIQPYASIHLKQPGKKLLRLEYTVKALKISTPYPFHNAYHDAYYTAEIFKKIMNSSIHPQIYNSKPIHTYSKPRQPKKVVDFEALISQFEKMYQRPMTKEEQSIIKLAYQMGKTGQFITQIQNKETDK